MQGNHSRRTGGENASATANNHQPPQSQSFVPGNVSRILNFSNHVQIADTQNQNTNDPDRRDDSGTEDQNTGQVRGTHFI
jgi:hypothetical protein